jgi:uncharacterized protein
MQIITFSLVMSLIFMAMDVYVLRTWSRFTQKHTLGPWWRRIPWVLAGIFGALMIVFAVRSNLTRLGGFEAVVLGLVMLWYLPKLGIVLVLGIRDLVKGAVRLVTRKKAATPDPAESTAKTIQGRRAFLAKASWTMAAVPYAMVANGMYRTRYDYEVVHVEVTMPHLPRSMDGIRIAQISDIHAGSYIDASPFQEARRLIAEERPDVIVITGDWVNAKPRELDLIHKDIALLRAPEGVYGSLGNHDHYNSPQEHAVLVKSIRSLGIDLMINEHRRIGNGDASIVLAATDNIGFRQNFGDVDAALSGIEGGEPTILLAHDPTLWDKQIVGQRSVDLMLSGHTHGGQIGINLMGFMWTPAAYVYEQYAGLYRKHDQLLYVNSGIGTVGPPLRIGVPPEITIFTLRASAVSDSVA